MNLHFKVWARVQWYWSGTEVAGIIKSLFVIFAYMLVFFFTRCFYSQASSCGRFERIFSDQYDYVSSQSFNGMCCGHQLSHY